MSFSRPKDIDAALVEFVSKCGKAWIEGAVIDNRARDETIGMQIISDKLSLSPCMISCPNS